MWLLCLTSFSKIFYSNGDVVVHEKLQNVCLCSALRVFEQRGIFIVRYLQWHGASVFEVSSEGPSQKASLYDKQGTQCWGPSLTRIPTGCFIMRTSNLRSWNWRPKRQWTIYEYSDRYFFKLHHFYSSYFLPLSVPFRPTPGKMYSIPWKLHRRVPSPERAWLILNITCQDSTVQVKTAFI